MKVHYFDQENNEVISLSYLDNIFIPVPNVGQYIQFEEGGDTYLVRTVTWKNMKSEQFYRVHVGVEKKLVFPRLEL